MDEPTRGPAVTRRDLVASLGASVVGVSAVSGVGAAVTDLRTISYGETAGGELTAGDPQDDAYAGVNYAEPVTFTGATGDRVEVTMRSKTFDTFVRVEGPDGTTAASDADADAAPDSTVSWTLAADGQYTIWAQSVSGTGTGEYTLSVRLLEDDPGDAPGDGESGTDGGNEDGREGDGDSDGDGSDEEPLAPREVGVSVTPADVELTPGGDVTLRVAVAGATTGVRSVNLTVRTSATAVAAIQDASVLGEPKVRATEVADDGSSATVQAVYGEARGGDGSGPPAVAELTLDAAALGSTSLTVDVGKVGDASNDTYTVARTTGATVSVVDDPEPTGPVLIEEPARDPDGDGLYEDVNGDGETTILDVSSFLNVHDGETVAANRAKFDYNDDGDITILDVAQLLRMY
jgi:hypothetical protein